jgi:hypothetical protein
MTDLPQSLPVKPGFLPKDQWQPAHGIQKPGFFGLA